MAKKYQEKVLSGKFGRMYGIECKGNSGYESMIAITQSASQILGE